MAILILAACGSRLLKTGDVDDESVAHVAPDHALVGFVDLLDWDHFT